MFKTLSLRQNHFQLVYLLVALICKQSVNAQGWKELNPPPNLFNQPIHAMTCTPAGEVYAAGDFKNDNGQNIVAVLNGDLWTELGTGNKSLKANNGIYALANHAGQLYAAGIFSNSAGMPYVARWDGDSWTEAGANVGGFQFNNSIYSLTTDKAGNLYAAGAFTNANGFSFVARWNGNSWTELGTGSNALKANAVIYAVVTDSSGDVYAAGQFTNTSGKYYVAKWNGSSWSELGTGVNALAANEYIQSLAINAAGNVYAAGSFTNGSGRRYVARWDGSSWSELGTNITGLNADDVITRLSLYQNGNVYAAGHFTDGFGNRAVHCWNGSSWQKLFVVPGNTGLSAINAMTIDASGNVYTGGTFKNSANRNYVAKWNGHSLTEPGYNGRNLQVWNGIAQIAAGPNGHVYAIGNFANNAGNNYIAHWDDKAWSELGGDSASLRIDHTISTMTTDHAGNLYVGSTFRNSLNHYYIAKWDGISWSQLGGPSDPIKVFEPITLLTSDKHGNIYAGGAFGDSASFSYGVTKWDGMNAIFYPFPGGFPVSLCVDSAGNIYAGNGQPDGNGKYTVVRIDAKGGTILGNGAGALNSGSPITALAIDAKGNLLASGLNNAGWSTYNKFVAKWDGTAWSEAGHDPSGKYAEGMVYSMTSDKDGNVYAGAYSGTALSSYTVAKWDGNQWKDMELNVVTNIYTVATDALGNVYAAGLFGNESNFQYVTKYEVGSSSINIPAPVVTGALATYCRQDGVQAIRITNLPDTTVVGVSIELDNNNIALGSDSSILFNSRDLEVGSHTLSVTFEKGDIRKTTSIDFEIMPASMPAVKLSASALVVNNTAITITANAISGGGDSPSFTFWKSASIDNPLSAESANNFVIIEPADLHAAQNWIYVRMRTSESCSATATVVDSILITRASLIRLADPDFPDVAIGSYPNPFTDNITLSGLSENKKYTVSLVNSLGSPVFEKQIDALARVSLQLPVLSGHIYWLQIYDNTKNRRIGTMVMMKR